MSVRRYRITEPTIAMSFEDSRGVARRMSTGTVVDVPGGLIEGNRLVEVLWDGKTVMMFTQDLRSRAEVVE